MVDRDPPPPLADFSAPAGAMFFIFSMASFELFGASAGIVPS